MFMDIHLSNPNFSSFSDDSTPDSISNMELVKRSSQSETLSDHLTHKVRSVFHDKVRDIFFFSERSSSGELAVFAYKKLSLLGQGTFGRVFDIDFITAPIFASLSGLVIKEPSDIPGSSKSLIHEYNILKELHEKGCYGIQSCPHLVTYEASNDRQAVYIARKFEFTLSELIKNAKEQKINLSPGELLKKGESLFLGLQFLFNQGIVHGDIKPENICAEMNVQGQSELRLADFGGARLLANIREPITVLSTFTATHISPQDFLSALQIEIESRFAVDQNMSILYKQIATRLDALDPYLPLGSPDYKSLLENFLVELPGMPLPNQESLNTETKELLQKHDVYALGKSLKELFEVISFSKTETRKQFDDLIEAMMEPDYKKRISINEALGRYQALLQNLSSP